MNLSVRSLLRFCPPSWRLSAWLPRLGALMLTLAALVPAAPVNAATLLTMDLTSTTQTGAAGSSLTFTGVLTNRTGVSLDATDLFLSFVGYDPDILLPTQLLGSTPFTLPHLTFTPTIGLFSVDIDAAAAAGSYGFAVQLQDIQGNLSDVATITINVTGPSNDMPEPHSLALVVLAGFAAAGLGRPRAPRGAAMQRQAA